MPSSVRPDRKSACASSSSSSVVERGGPWLRDAAQRCQRRGAIAVCKRKLCLDPRQQDRVVAAGAPADLAEHPLGVRCLACRQVFASSEQRQPRIPGAEQPPGLLLVALGRLRVLAAAREALGRVRRVGGDDGGGRRQQGSAGRKHDREQHCSSLPSVKACVQHGAPEETRGERTRRFYSAAAGRRTVPRGDTDRQPGRPESACRRHCCATRTCCSPRTRVTRARCSNACGIARPARHDRIAARAQRARARPGAVVERLLAGARVALVSDAGTPLDERSRGGAGAAAARGGHRGRGRSRALARDRGAVASPACRPIASRSRDSCRPSLGAASGALQALAHEPRTLVFYEAPHRLAGVRCSDLAPVFGAERAPRSRAKSRSDSRARLSRHARPRSRSAPREDADMTRGEIVLVVHGRRPRESRTNDVDALDCGCCARCWRNCRSRRPRASRRSSPAAAAKELYDRALALGTPRG